MRVEDSMVFIKNYFLRSATLLFCTLIISGCFAIKQDDRNRVVSGLGDSVWPIHSGIYSKKSGEKFESSKITIRRKITHSGARVYINDQDPGEFYAFYPRSDGYFIIENFQPKNEWSLFTYAQLYDGNTVVGSYDNGCQDLSESQRLKHFGKTDVKACQTNNLLGLLFLLNIAFNNNSKIKSIYKLEKTVDDAF